MALRNNGSSRWWCFTWQVPDDLSWDLAQEAMAAVYRKERVLALVANPEEAPITGQRHWQAVLRLDSPRKFSFVKKLLPEGCHIEKTKYAMIQAELEFMQLGKAE